MIRHFLGRAIFVACSYLAFVCLAGAAVTLGSLGVDIQRPDTSGALRLALIAVVMAAVIFAIGYTARRLLAPRA